MKTLLNNQKSKLILAAFATSLLASSVHAGESTPSYAEIKSQIVQNERIALIKKRDNLAQNIANREHLYVSNILDKTREDKRWQRSQ